MRIRIEASRAIELFNKGDNIRNRPWLKGKPIETEEELGDAMGHGRSNGVVNISDLSAEELEKLAGSDFLKTDTTDPWPCIIHMIKESYPHIFWIGSCASSEKDEV